MQRLLIQAKYEADGFYEMFLLDLSTGLRRGELLGLLWGDINFETGELKVTKVCGRKVADQATENQSSRANDHSATTTYSGTEGV